MITHLVSSGMASTSPRWTPSRNVDKVEWRRLRSFRIGQSSDPYRESLEASPSAARHGRGAAMLPPKATSTDASLIGSCSSS